MAQIKQEKKIILASGSRTRAQMLKNLGLTIEIIPSDLDEDTFKAQSLAPSQLAIQLAHAKAQIVSQKYPDTYVIAADQVCQINNEILGKPLDIESNIQHLQKLSGKVHLQHCANVIYFNQKSIFELCKSPELKMRSLNIEEIKAYIALDNPLNAAGGFHFEGYGKLLFEEIIGACLNKANAIKLTC
jgi:septum formation protein